MKVLLSHVAMPYGSSKFISYINIAVIKFYFVNCPFSFCRPISIVILLPERKKGIASNIILIGGITDLTMIVYISKFSFYKYNIKNLSNLKTNKRMVI